MAITKDDVLSWIRDYAQVIEENFEMLTDLDREIGDADHGANMRRGFKAVLEKLPSVEDKDIGAILKSVGMTLLSKVGGAAGPLYSTFFMKAGTTIGAKSEMAIDDWAKALEASTAGIAALGKAQPNDKTMLDALYPAVDALNTAIGNGSSNGEALQKSADAAHEGMLATIPLVARKGRASYLGERSAGHQDPGATSSYLLIKSAAETWADS
ncbi:MAG: dihydroxyacetone kinase subunit DhaL [Anaerolineaceae bacterium]|nr:dihydroxyacetone kinase subunit DhaL [Anaerolineaceae bacterium]MDD4042821.1 dihydroxyacetone kinase subunit DhaL [Anaerolineaceae bacterium]MDD4577951.1 dihydroxyacetone kinase subunit DhaL [Anaerolineaceae bacterium]